VKFVISRNDEVVVHFAAGQLQGSTMRISSLTVVLLVGLFASAAGAEENKEDEKADCQSRVMKHVLSLGDLLREQKPKGNCAIARWSIERHEEKLRIFNAEPEECRKTDLGKKYVSTVKSVIGQEQRTLKRSCKRKG
jgi:hypothetical protein